MEKIKSALKSLDKFQQRHKTIAFPAAVFKKYGEDEGGHLTALITYYSFLSLFPLLLAVASATQIFLKNNEHLRAKVIESISHYFPVISDELQSNIHTMHKTGIALLIGILVTLYGARGGADAIRHAFNQIWHVPRKTRPGFPASVLNSLLIIFVGGGGLVLASTLSGYASGLNPLLSFRVLPIAISFITLVGVFYLVFSLGITSRQPRRRDLFFSALIAAIGVQVLQIIGFYLISHELRNLSNLYGAFAIVLGMIFWIYLQVQVLIFAALSGAVRAKRLWPRSLID